MRARLPTGAAVVLLAGPAVLAFFSGGFFEEPRLIAAVAAWVIAAVAAVTVPRPLPRSASGRAALAGLALLTAWTALSYEWAPLGERAQADVQRLLLYLGLFAAAIALLRGPAARRLAEPVLALGAFAVTCYGLSARLLPTLVDLERSRSADGRLEQPLTYWNAMGCLSAIGLVLCVRLAADPRRTRGVRAAAAFCGPALGLGVYLSFSRGALFALGAGLAALVVLSPAARVQLRSAAVLVGAGALAALVASLLPRVESLAPGQTGDGGDGLLMLAALVVLSAAAAAFSARSSIPAASASGPRVGRRATAVALAALVLGSVAGAALLEDSPAARPGGNATSATRFGSADTTRYAFWEVALDSFADDPLKGTGSGGFAVEWRREPGRRERAVDAHSLYVETLSELGVVGAAFLLLFLGGVVASTVRLQRLDPAAVAGPAAALLVWGVHAGLDWDWELPALTGIALLLAAAMVAWADEPASPAPAGRVRDIC